MQDILTGANFSKYLDQTFQIVFDDHDPIPLQLREVQMTKLSPLDVRNRYTPEERRPPFSLLFRGPAQIILPQRLYRFDHTEMGAFDMFIVPIGADTDGVTYEAVFT